MTLPHPLPGEELEILGRPVDFSFFPVVYRSRGWTPSNTIFAVSPWAVMQGAINTLAPEQHREEARAFLRQARDFYTTAAEHLSANPLLFYYSFLNLGKALLRTRGFDEPLHHAHHGLSELRPSDVPLEAAGLKVSTRVDEPNVFREVMTATEYGAPAKGAVLRVSELLAQVVVGHRQWRDGSGSNERFIGIKKLEIAHDSERHQMWLRIYVAPPDLSAFNIGVTDFAGESALTSHGFRVVRSPIQELRCYEQQTPTPYRTDPADGLPNLVRPLKPLLWRIASSIPGSAYRRYYVHLTPPNERQNRIGQLPALWAALYYFGSMVRYRPHLFDGLTEGAYGAFVSEFVAAQPEQLLYLMASEMCRREVAKPAIA